MVTREEIRKNQKKIIPNCKIVEENGVKRVVCEPLLEKGDEKLPICDRPVVGKITKGYGDKVIVELEDDGGCAPEVILEIDDYLSRLGKTIAPPAEISQPTKEEIKKVI